MAESKKLLDILGAELKKDDKALAQERLQNDVARQKNLAEAEILSLKEALFNAESHYAKIYKTANTKLIELIQAQDTVSVAEANLKQAEAILKERF